MENRNTSRTACFVSAGIDDLAKYRIVELLLQTSALAGSARYFVDTLGLRPAVLVHQLLEELVQRGILCVTACSSSPLPTYTLTPDRSIRQQLERLYALSAEPSLRTPLLEQLAQRSLRKVAVLTRGRQPARQLAGQTHVSTGTWSVRQSRLRAVPIA